MTTAHSAQLIVSDRSNSVIQQPSASRARSTNYSAFGYCAMLPDERASPGFNGQLQERNRTYLLGSYRAYLPWLTRFACPDNLSPFGKGGLNAYAYCNGDPVNKTDPSGHEPLGVDIGSVLAIGSGALALAAGGRALLAKSLAKNQALKRLGRKNAAWMIYGGVIGISGGAAGLLMPKGEEWTMMRAMAIGVGAIGVAGGFYRGVKGAQKAKTVASSKSIGVGTPTASSSSVSSASGLRMQTSQPSTHPSLSSASASQQGSMPDLSFELSHDGGQRRASAGSSVSRQSLSSPRSSVDSNGSRDLLNQDMLERLTRLRELK
jgi:RHS repeat-associated protein